MIYLFNLNLFNILIYSIINMTEQVLTVDSIICDNFSLSTNQWESGRALSSIGGVVSVPINNKLYDYWGNELNTTIANTDRDIYYGSSVAMSAAGDRMLIGAPGINKVYAYTRVGASWVIEATLSISSIPESGTNKFGQSIALSADGVYAFIGAVSLNNPRAVYVFKRIGTSWSEIYTISVNGSVNDIFGHSIACSANGNRVIISAPHITIPKENSTENGKAYIFKRTNSTFTQETSTALIASDVSINNLNIFFGTSVSMDATGSTVLIGASGSSSFGAVSGYNGKAYIFTRSNSSWNAASSGILAPSDPPIDDYSFGASVSLTPDGNMAAVSNPGNQSKTGFVSIYTSSDSWVTHTHQTSNSLIVSSDNAVGDLFGYSIVLSADGTYLFVGAPDFDSITGAVYAFKRINSGSTWIQLQKITASYTLDNSSFGHTVSISADGQYLVTGFKLDRNISTGHGSVFTYSAGDFVPTKITGEQEITSYSTNNTMNNTTNFLLYNVTTVTDIVNIYLPTNDVDGRICIIYFVQSSGGQDVNIYDASNAAPVGYNNTGSNPRSANDCYVFRYSATQNSWYTISGP